MSTAKAQQLYQRARPHQAALDHVVGSFLSSNMADRDLSPDPLKGQFGIDIGADKPATQQFNKQLGIGPVDKHVRNLTSIRGGSNKILVHVVSDKYHALRRQACALKRTL